MKSQQYHDLVRKYEREAKQNPDRFHRRLHRQLLLGYGYVFFILLLLIGISVGCGVVTFLLPGVMTFILLAFAVGFTWDLLRTLLAKIPPLEGIRLAPADFPKLFAEMNELRELMDIPEVEDVILIADFNAYAGEHRTRFFFGQKQRYVGLGLPLLEALSASEFRTVLAHEIAHLARGHSQILATVWHLRNVWFKILSGGEVSFWWRWFAKHFGSQFEAMSAVVSREFEFEADRIAFSVTDSRNNIATSLKMELLGRTADAQQTQWVNAQVFESPDVPSNVISTYCKRLQQELDRTDSENLLRRILAEETSIYLTHPSCRDRIAEAGFPSDLPLAEMVQTALGYLQPFPEDNAQIASFYYLGSKRDSLLKQLDNNFVAESQAMWKYRSEAIANAKTQLREIDHRINEARASGSKPLELDVVRRAEITSDFFPREAARQAYEDVLEHYPENATALFYTGYDAFEYDYDLVTAENRLASAIEADPRVEYEVSNFMVAIYRELEKPAEASQWQEHSFGAYDALQDSWDERTSVTLNDKLIPATLTDEQVHAIESQIKTLENQKYIKRVWVACKKVKLYPEKPLFMLGVETNVSMFSYRTVDFFNAIGDEFANTVNFGNQFFVVVIQGENRKFKRRFKKLKPPFWIDIDNDAV